MYSFHCEQEKDTSPASGNVYIVFCANSSGFRLVFAVSILENSGDELAPTPHPPPPRGGPRRGFGGKMAKSLLPVPILDSLNTVMQRTANENAAGLRRICKRSSLDSIVVSALHHCFQILNMVVSIGSSREIVPSTA